MRSSLEIVANLKRYLDNIRDGYEIERIPVKSSNLVSVGLNPFKHILEIEFKGDKSKGNSIYQYQGVPNDVFLGLMMAESCGKYFHKNIKEKYRGIKVN